ncbi:hypothetical protein V6N13_020997 [Hibiscus sabdariffa]
MYFDFLGNPTSGQLLSPTGRPPDPSSGGVCMDEAVNYGIDSGQRNRLSTDQMDMDVNLGCDKYGHSKESCGSSGDGVSIEKLIRHPEPLVDDKFGPWRQVSSRKCRPTVMRRGLHAENSSVAPRSGSRFDVLAHVVEGSSDVVGRGKEAAAISLGVLPVDVSAGVDLREQGRVPKGSDQHSLVVVTETKTAAGVLPQVTFTEPIPSPHVVAKGQDACSKKKDEMSQSQTVVAEWAAHVSKSLSMDGVHGSSSECQITESPVTSVHNEIQWIENSTYEGDVQANVQ